MIRYTSMIGDVVQSRKLRDRASAQGLLEQLVGTVNEMYRPFIASQFVITTGDEIQGLLLDPTIAPDIIRLFDVDFRVGKLRFGVGYGQVTTELRPVAIGMDGETWYRAREAINSAKARGQLGGNYLGFSHEDDMILSAIAHSMQWHRSRVTSTFQGIIQMIELGQKQREISEVLGMSPQQVSVAANRFGWDIYRENREAMVAILAKYRMNT